MIKNILSVTALLIISNLVWSQEAFNSLLPLSPVNIVESTKEKPQAKSWNYAGHWWSVLVTPAGTTIMKLQGRNWFPDLNLGDKTYKVDCYLDGGLVHLLLFKGGGNNSFLFTAQYNQSTGHYEKWAGRSEVSVIKFPDSAIIATITKDASGRMWAASTSNGRVYTWWSDAPYAKWSAPIKIATGITNEDISAICTMPAINKIAVIWSDHHDKKFGCKVHTVGDDPAVWSADEVPASHSAINSGAGMADDHLNIKVGKDGTLYCAAKSDYNEAGLPKLILLVRRTSGTWDNAYTVTIEPEGTQPLLLLNEAKKKMTVVYTSAEYGGDILYRESALNPIAFGKAGTLFNGGNALYDFSAGPRENYTNDVLIMATKMNGNSMQAVSVLASETAMPDSENASKNFFVLNAIPNPFSARTTVNFTLIGSGEYSLDVYDIYGIKKMTIQNGKDEMNKVKSAVFNASILPAGLYFITLQNHNRKQTIRVIKAQ